MVNQIKEYWASLQPRERHVLSWGALLVSVILFYALFWQPLQKSISFMEESVRDLRTSSVWVEQRAEEMQRETRPSPRPSSAAAGQSLLSMVETTANKARLGKAIQQMVPSKDGREVSVVLEEADFNQWVLWVDDLYKNYNVGMSQINAEKDDEKPNIAEIRVTFTRD